MLDGKTIFLRAPLDEDGAFLLELRNNFDLQIQLMSLPRPNSRGRLSEWLNQVLSDPMHIFFVVVDKTSARTIGFIQIARMNFIHGTGELGICFSEESRGGGRAQEALSLLEKYIKSVFRLRKIHLQVLNKNSRAKKFYMNCGYLKVGILRRHFYHDNAYHDVAIYEKILG